MPETPPLPIIYVRGYAMRDKDIQGTVDDPFYGFSRGSTHVRIGADNEPRFFGFEGALLRLMTDWGYTDRYERGLQPGPTRPGVDGAGTAGALDDLPPGIWIYRYYDVSTGSHGHDDTTRLPIEEAAEGLYDLVRHIRRERGQKVVLVAHSMGGLVCRSLIERTYRMKSELASDDIDRVFTYATPHGGIDFVRAADILEKARDFFGPWDMDTFGDDRMQEFLRVEGDEAREQAGFDPRRLLDTDNFDPSRVFCLVGTNADDYSGVISKVVGIKSDGLVQTDEASVVDSPTAWVHRSHGGRYGIVNSEEGYQHLQRFLFGDTRIHASLRGVEGLSAAGGPRHQAEVTLAIRGLPILLHERTAAHHCPIEVEPGTEIVDLLTTYLSSDLVPEGGDGWMRYVISLKVAELPPSDRWGVGFDFRDFTEQLPAWEDRLLVAIRRDGEQHRTEAVWHSAGTREESRGAQLSISLPEQGREVAGPDAAVVLALSEWTPARARSS